MADQAGLKDLQGHEPNRPAAHKYVDLKRVKLVSTRPPVRGATRSDAVLPRPPAAG